MACCKKKINNSIFNQHGLKSTGIYQWPYAACSSKINNNGNFETTSQAEAIKICMDFCQKQNSISGNRKGSAIFNKLSNISDQDCETQCRMCLKNIEAFTHKKDDKSNIFLWLVGCILFFLIIFIKVIY